MSKRKGRVPNRLATRKQSHLRVVPDGGPPAVTVERLDEEPRGPVVAVTASLLAEIAKVRTPPGCRARAVRGIQDLRAGSSPRRR